MASSRLLVALFLCVCALLGVLASSGVQGVYGVLPLANLKRWHTAQSVRSGSPQLLLSTATKPYKPRDVRVIAGQFVNHSGEVEQLRGSNVVVKGPPWLPSIHGTSRCGEMPTGHVCETFNQQDIDYLKMKGYNLIRLGVVWAGGQPSSAEQLDDDFKDRLQKILDLCHKNQVRVILDIHQDAMSSVHCGEGVPLWYIQDDDELRWLVGKPLVGYKNIFHQNPFGKCGIFDISSWREHSDSPRYNVLNECCRRFNSPSNGWGAYLDPGLNVQYTIRHLVKSEKGRKAYATYARLLAEAVAEYPAAIGIELMNEPPFRAFEAWDEDSLFDLYEECYRQIREVSADLAVGLSEAGQVSSFANDKHLPRRAREWLRHATNLMYTFHWYGGFPVTLKESIRNAKELSALWRAVPVLTEFSNYKDETTLTALRDAAVSWTYYEYNSYCNVPPSAANSTCMPENETCAFGACIT